MDDCKSCGACEKHIRCDHCGNCRTCGKAMASQLPNGYWTSPYMTWTPIWVTGSVSTK
jgi:hypothetical protein